MYWWDPTYIIILPAILVAIWAQYNISSTFNKYKKVASVTGKKAWEVAREILNINRLEDVGIEKVSGNLTDHYDPRSKVLRLSDSVYNSTSIAAIGVAAHEAGHAIQHANRYAPLTFRNSIVPAVKLINWAALPIIILGFIMAQKHLIHIGIFLFTGAVIFQLITLPVEFDASKRALKILDGGYLNKVEFKGAKKVLSAAALTYIAAALVSVLQLIRLLYLAGLLGRSND